MKKGQLFTGATATTAAPERQHAHRNRQRILAWLAPPQDEGTNQSRTARNAYFILVGIIPVSILLPQFALRIRSVENQPGMAIGLVVAVLFTLLLCLLKLGVIQFVNHAIVGIGYGAVFTTLVLSGGIRDISLILMPIVLVFASVLLSNRWVLLYGVLISLGTILLYWAEVTALLPNKFSDQITLDRPVLVLFVVSLMTIYLYNSYTRLIAYANQVEHQAYSLQETIDELQAIHQSLELRTQELTAVNTQMRSTQKQLVEAEKMASLGSLVAGVAHEVNTPLGISVTAASTLSLATQELIAHYESGGFRRSYFEAYLSTTIKGNELILNSLQRVDQLMQSFKQLAVDQLTLERRTFYLRAYLEEIVRSIESMLRAGHHTITLNVRDEIQLHSYPGAFAQVIINLITNSITHGYEHRNNGHLCVCAQIVGERVQITYQDDGCGIPPEYLGKIYEPFFTTARDRGGTGLGLHVVYNLVTQKLGGTIHHTSTVGQGTAFHLNLPLSVS
ncbi:MAG: HAMP domain-containing histidine kinase [Caldilineaceae bacterium]|nr:HAMP domain-containing histidine kinase [Caldilineaceae bacterium]